jgi:hypothetical protein
VAKALTLLLALLLSGGEAPPPVRTGEAPVLHWFRGNTHTHTLLSDGDSSPEDVVRWYRDHGYHFLVITDHDKITSVSDDKLLLIAGEEVTDHLPKKPLHVNAIGLKNLVKPQGGSSPLDVLQRNVNAIRDAGGIPAINHPNFGWAFGADVLKRLENVKLVEIASGHPYVNMEGGGGVPSVEAMWDEVLTSGKTLYGIAVDDSHHLKFETTKGNVALPGRAWIVVRASSLTREAVIKALERGEFYSSKGPELTEYTVTDSSISVTIGEHGGARFRTQFIGSSGRLLLESTGNPATYRIRGGEGYVRTKVIDSNGNAAWTQPVRIAP